MTMLYTGEISPLKELEKMKQAHFDCLKKTAKREKPQHAEPTCPDVQKLCEMLSYKRPHGSQEVDEFVMEFILPLATDDSWSDKEGNIFISTDEKSTTLFLSHVDTVHSSAGRQKVYHHNGVLAVESDCLGADDGAGVWLMLEMIKAGVPGVYGFMQGEECGGIGSKFAAKEEPDYFASFERAISFDRRGCSSVITHQSFGRCCSDAFATALATGLSAWMPETHKGFELDDGGTFTDSRNFTDLIGECTNVSCGYASEHSERETLDTTFLKQLRDACIKVDWESLPAVRKPGEVDEEWFGYGGLKSGWGYYAKGEMAEVGYESGYSAWDFGWERKVRSVNAVTLYDLYELDELELEQFVADEPGQAASLMLELLYQGGAQ